MTKTVLITGASSGIGAATAGYFSDRGWNVAATMRNPAAAGDLAGRSNVLTTALDVQQSDSISRAVEQTVTRFGQIDVVINNAGFSLYGVFEATSPEKILEQFEVNLFGPMAVMRAVLPHFRSRRAGTIINVSSGAGVFGLPLITLYTASKFALEGFSESVAWEPASVAVRVKIVEPGGVTTTAFGKRSGAEVATIVQLTDYGPFMDAAAKAFAGMAAIADASESDVAAVIFTAATDDSDQLRYIATDDIRPMVAARRETSEAEYIAEMRLLFSGLPRENSLLGSNR